MMHPQKQTAAPGLQPQHGRKSKQVAKPLNAKNHKTPLPATVTTIPIYNDDGHLIAWRFFAQIGDARAFMRLRQGVGA